MHKRAEARGPTDATESWNAWFDTTLEVWKNISGIGAEYFENYTNFVKNLEHTNQEYLRQLQPGLLTPPQTTTSGKTALQLAPLPPVGARATRTRTITRATIANFAELSGDVNPIHLDPVQAAKSPFGERIAHGSLVASFISAVLGNDLPGPGTIYLGQTLKFLAPVRIGDTVTASVEGIAVHEQKRLITLRTECTNQEGTVVLTGEAVVKYLREVEAG